MRKSPLVLLLLAGLLAGCGSSGNGSTASTSGDTALDQSAARFAVRNQALLKQGKFTAAWRTLYPAEKRVVPAARLAACYPKNQFPGTVTFSATKTRDVRWLVPGTSNSTDAKAVTVTATTAGQPKQTFEQHLVRRGSGWAWMLSAKYFAAAQAGRC